MIFWCQTLDCEAHYEGTHGGARSGGWLVGKVVSICPNHHETPIKATKQKCLEWYQRLMGVVGWVRIAAQTVQDGRKATPEEMDNAIFFLEEQRAKLDIMIDEMKRREER